jgi:hypothetical protein
MAWSRLTTLEIRSEFNAFARAQEESDAARRFWARRRLRALEQKRRDYQVLKANPARYRRHLAQGRIYGKRWRMRALSDPVRAERVRQVERAANARHYARLKADPERWAAYQEKKRQYYASRDKEALRAYWQAYREDLRAFLGAAHRPGRRKGMARVVDPSVALALYEEGVRAAEIARRFEVTPCAVYKALKKARAAQPPAPPSPDPIEQARAIIARVPRRAAIHSCEKPLSKTVTVTEQGA